MLFNFLMRRTNRPQRSIRKEIMTKLNKSSLNLQEKDKKSIIAKKKLLEYKKREKMMTTKQKRK